METLEERRMLSASPWQPTTALKQQSTVIHAARHNPLPPGFGGLGDSYVAPYEFAKPPRTYAYNFVEQLSRANIAYYGALTTTPIQDAGYAYDWAVGGAVSSDLQSQLTGLLPQIAAGDISYVTISIGGNDFENDVILAKPSKPLEALPAFVWGNIQSAVNQILAASSRIKVVLNTLQDLASTPRLESLVAHGTVSAGTIGLADEEQDVVNADMRSEARHNARVAVADFQSQLNAVESEPTLTVGNITVSTTTTGIQPTDLFLSDGEHPGTVEQGLMANTFINAINAKFGVDFADLTPAQVDAFAAEAYA